MKDPDPTVLAQLARNLANTVDHLAGLIGPRHLGPPRGMAAAATLLERELIRLGYGVRRETYSAQGEEVANLIAEIPGASRPQEIVILGAHYDTVETTPGADDNASGAAVLLEVARLMRPAAPKRTLRFVAFACEEAPHFLTREMGSQVHAEGCRKRGEKVVGMLSLEMLGYYSTAAGSQALPPTIPGFLRWIFPKRGDFVAAVGNLTSMGLLGKFRRGFKRTVRFPLFSICLPEAIGEIRRSDNSSFWDQGYSALMLTDTSFLRNPHYHQPSDTPDTLDYERMSEVTLGIVGGLSRLTGADLGR